MLSEARSRSRWGNKSDSGRSEGPARCINEDLSSFFSASERRSAVDPHPVHRWVGSGAGGTPAGLPGPLSAAPTLRRAPVPPARCPPTAAAAAQRPPGTSGGLPAPPERCPGYRTAPGSPQRFLRGAPGTPVPGGSSRLPYVATPQYSGTFPGGLPPVPGRTPGFPLCPAPTRGPRGPPWQPVAPKMPEAVKSFVSQQWLFLLMEEGARRAVWGERGQNQTKRFSQSGRKNLKICVDFCNPHVSTKTSFHSAKE